jgi:hypothetical protein
MQMSIFKVCKAALGPYQPNGARLGWLLPNKREVELGNVIGCRLRLHHSSSLKF